MIVDLLPTFRIKLKLGIFPDLNSSLYKGGLSSFYIHWDCDWIEVQTEDGFSNHDNGYTRGGTAWIPINCVGTIVVFGQQDLQFLDPGKGVPGSGGSGGGPGTGTGYGTTQPGNPVPNGPPNSTIPGLTDIFGNPLVLVPARPMLTAVDKFWQILDEDEKFFWNSNHDIADEIIDYLNINGANNIQAQQTALAIFKAVVAEGYSSELISDVFTAMLLTPVETYTSADYPGKNDGMPFEWWKNESYISSHMGIQPDNINAPVEVPNALELILFSRFPLPAVAHLKNSVSALDRAQELVSTNVYTHIHNGKADAFRHAYWNALDVGDIGNFFTKLFTDAHEWNSDNHPLETAMDNHNNAVGREIGDGYSIWASDSSIEQGVNAFLGNGDLKYLSPLATGDGNNILPSTTIKFTNQ